MTDIITIVDPVDDSSFRPSRGRRIVELDGLRGIAIALVVYFHYVSALRSLPAPGLSHVLDIAGRFGWAGVDLFFVLSGFLIGGILLDNRSGANSMRVFYIRRAFRIIPLYLVVVIAGISMASTVRRYGWGSGQYLPAWVYLAFAQNMFIGFQGKWCGPVLSPTWSLAVEEQFYLVAPLLVYILSRRALAFLVVVLIAAAPLIRWLCQDIGVFNFTVVRWDSLLMGVGLAILWRERDFGQRAKSLRNALIVAAVALGLVVTVATLMDLRYLNGPPSVWLYSVLGLLFVITMIGALWPSDTRFRKILRYPLLVRLGQISFGVYLIHFPALYGFHRVLLRSAPTVDNRASVLVTILALVATLILAEGSYRFFEYPLIRFGHRFKYLASSSGSGACGLIHSN